MLLKRKELFELKEKEETDVVYDMFLANSHPAIILFDSGASHSFISASFVAKYSLPIATMDCTMLVSSLGGEMRTRRLCPAVSLKIRGGRLPVEPHYLRLPRARYYTGYGLVKQV
jgi:hypothetical protein